MVSFVIVLIVLFIFIRDSITKYIYVTKPMNELKKPLRTRAQFIEESLHPKDEEPDMQSDILKQPQMQSSENCDNMSKFQCELQSALQTKEQIMLHKRLQEDLELKRIIELEYSTIKKALKENAMSGDYSMNVDGQKVVHTLSTRLTYGLKTVSGYSPSYELRRSGADSLTVLNACSDPCTVVVATTPSQQRTLDIRMNLMKTKISTDNISICQVVVYYTGFSHDLKTVEQYPFPAIADVGEHQDQKNYWDVAFEYSCIVP